MLRQVRFLAPLLRLTLVASPSQSREIIVRVEVGNGVEKGLGPLVKHWFKGSWKAAKKKEDEYDEGSWWKSTKESDEEE